VVEDDPDTLEMLDDLLVSEGYHTLLRQQAKDTQFVLRQARPDLLVLDLWLEAPNAGELLLGVMAGDPVTRNIPVIVSSAHLDVLVTKAAVFRQRGYHMLAKPFSADALLSAVHALIGPAPVAGDRTGP
jgi:two-component system nitrogen regulation response regulator NtrX